MERNVEMARIARAIMDMAQPYAPRINIGYRKETDETVKDYTDWARQWHGILPGQEYFIITRDCELLYFVNVTGDSYLTAAEELIRMVAAKF